MNKKCGFHISGILRFYMYKLLKYRSRRLDHFWQPRFFTAKFTPFDSELEMFVWKFGVLEIFIFIRVINMLQNLKKENLHTKNTYC